MNTFIFAIGGTGSRVLKSLMGLIASDHTINSTVIPIILDMDVLNGDTARTLKMLDEYIEVQKDAYPDEMPKEGFFRNKVKTLGSLGDNNGVTDAFQLNFGAVPITFHQYFKGNQLDDIDNDFLASLYDNSSHSNPHTEINLNLRHGFKGNPNIGSVVFNGIVNTPEWKLFENVFGQNDRIFIVSSIFGGTGASGFPQLIKNIRSSSSTFLRDADIGALVVMPYFNVETDEKSTINSDTFNSKTKSALTYYNDALDKKVNSIYYIADESEGAINNIQGGDAQKNKASVIELIGASAIVEFLNKKTSDMATTYYEFGIKNNNPTLKLEDLYEHKIWEEFGRFSMFARNFKNDLRERLNEAFAKNMDLTNKLQNDNALTTLDSFIDRYIELINEMGTNQSRSFKPFEFEKEIGSFINGQDCSELNNKFLNTIDPFTTNYNIEYRNINKNGKLPNSAKVLKLLYSANKSILQKHNVKFQ